MHNFKESMSRILNTVSVLAIPNEETLLGIDAATISSLVSTSVQEGEEEIMFILKKNSYLTEKLKIGIQFSVNVLSDSQKNIAAFYGGGSPNLDEVGNSNISSWEHFNAIPRLCDAHVNLMCLLEGLHKRRSSTLFFAKVTSHKFTEESHPLLHYQRDYYSIDGKL